ncbi:MAG TPA: aldo/keto reductase [Firmicutes bacterium]|nr:aldo/keto reductase [Bacillota bacterium]
MSYGAWVTFGTQLDVDAALACMDAAYQAGVNFFDNAEIYAQGQAETIMGQALKKSGWKRSDIVVSTKLFWGGDGPNDRGLSRKHILEGMDAALERLQMNYVDLVFCHRPDYDTPVEETVRAMSYLVNTGKAFYWGTSEWPAERIWEAHAVARREHLVPPQMEQPQYNMFHRERFEVEYDRLYREAGMGTTIWSPLASGVLTGKYNEGIPEGSRAALDSYQWIRKRIEGEEGQAQIEKVRQLVPVAKDIGCTMAQLALAWCLKNSNVSTVITGSTTVEQTKENMQAMDVAEKLDAAQMERIEGILGNKPEPVKNFR